MSISAVINPKDIIDEFQSKGFMLKRVKDTLQCISTNGAVLNESQRQLLKDNKQYILNELEDEIVSTHDVESIYRLSPLQKGLLYQYQTNPNSDNYHVQLQWTINKNIVVDRFNQSWQQIIDAEPVLRSAFISDMGDEPIQVVYKKIKLDWQYFDYSSYDENVKVDLIKKYLDDDRKIPFKLEKPGQNRICCIRWSAEKFICVWSHHHIILDGWSVFQILKKLNHQYASAESSLDYQSVHQTSYADYITWLNGTRKEDSEEFWKKNLEDVDQITLPPMANETFSQHNYVASARSVHAEMKLPEKLIENLQKLSQDLQVTMNSLFQFAWALYLYRNNFSLDKVVYGMTSSGRAVDFKGIESIVGLLINTSPVAISLNSTESCQYQIKRFHEHLQQVNLHSLFELSALQKFSQVEWPQQLFTSIFVFENYPISQELKSETIPLPLSDFIGYEKPSFPLVVVATTEPALGLKLIADESLYKKEVLDHILAHMFEILSGLVENYSYALNKISYLTIDEIQSLSILGHGTHIDSPSPLLHDRFLLQASLTPDSIALSSDGDEITYKKLDLLSNYYAAMINDKIASSGHRVAVLFPRGIDAVIAILSILKAGHTYVPVDPNQPIQRIEYILKDSEVSMVLCDATSKSVLTSIDDAFNFIEVGHSEHIPVDQYFGISINISEHAPAYIIYTSGSTGKPKGVIVTHRNIQSRISWLIDKFGFDSSDVILQNSTLTFDFSLPEIFCALSSGGKVVIPNSLQQKDMAALLDIIRDQKITVLHFVPTVASYFIDVANDSLLPDCRHVFFGGEILHSKLVKSFKRVTVNAELYNVYGPTEATVYSTWHNCELGTDGPQSIGKPTPNSTISILSKDKQLVAHGVVGEIAIAGPGVTDGYVNLSDLNAEKFIKNPPESDERMYLSGDLARWCDNGDLEYIGRKDYQVKIRGFRIELGEIEAAMLLHEHIESAVVIVCDHNGEKTLCAYYTSTNCICLPELVLREHLSKHVNYYMIPAIFIHLDFFEMTESGKINRHRLPKPDMNDLHKSSYESPKTEMEWLIHDIWKGILKLDKISVNDNFFHLGGHSLLATKAITTISVALDVACNVKMLFDNPTVTSFAKCLMEYKSGQYLIPKYANQNNIPLSHAQSRLWFLNQYEANQSATYNVPFAYRISGDVDVDRLRTSIAHLVERHRGLRTIITVNESGEATQRILPHDQSGVDLLVELCSSEEFGSKIERDSRHSFDLEHGPLVRFTLYKANNSDNLYALSIVQHHIITDAWSIEVMIRDLNEIYQQNRADYQEINLQKIDIEYTDYAIWQRQYINSVNFQEQIHYWQDHLKDLQTLEFPTSRLRPPIQNYRGNRRTIQLPASLITNLRELAKSENCTLYMVMLTAFNILLARYCGQEDITIGSLIANRNMPQVVNIIGFFANMLVLRNHVAEQKVTEILGQIKKSTLTSQNHQDMPFEYLVDMLDIERDQSRSPLIQIIFGYEHYSENNSLKLGMASVEPINIDSPISKFDLTLTVKESQEKLYIEIEYNSDLFELDFIDQINAHMVSICEFMVNRPTESISRISLYDLSYLNNQYSNSIVNRNTTIVDLIERQANLNPEKIALIYSDQAITYQQLNKLSNQLAHKLRDEYKSHNNCELQRNDYVAIYANRSIEVIVAMIAVLKSGGAYVPVDSRFPEARIQFILQDTQCRLILKSESLQLNSEIHGDVPVLELDLLAIDNELSCANLDLNIRANDIAYAIYTSGTTGVPKGVMVSHHNVVRLFESASQYYDFKSDDVWSFYHSFAFDVSVWEVFGAISQGASIVVISEDETKDPNLLFNCLYKNNVSIFSQTPSAFEHFASYAIQQQNKLTSLRYVIFAGEDIKLSSLYPWWETYGYNQPKLINMYGITEITVHATYHWLNETDVCKNAIYSPIGKPLNDLVFYLLDQQRRIVPPGLIGEIYIAGDGVASGYLNRADLTAERFIQNPFYTENLNAPAMRYMYKSGDLARARFDGSFEYVGRNDKQVKIRGFRIEIGEIEKTLLTHISVQQCVVTVYEHEDHKQLVAYIIISAEHKLIEDDIINHLRSSLPVYMIPNYFIEVEKFPLTSTGKMDYRSLPAPRVISNQLDSYIAPNNELEILIADAWQQVLGIDKISTNANFFRIGGDSIISIQLVSKLRRVRLHVSVKDIFSSPTISGLAAKVKFLEGIEIDQKLQQGTFSLSPIQLMFFNENYENPHHWNQSRMWCINPISPDSLQKAIGKLIDHHDSLRLKFKTINASLLVQEYCSPKESAIAINVLDISKVSSSKISITQNTWCNELQSSLDYELGPIMAVGLLTGYQDGYDRLFIAIHHLVIDGVSWRILESDLKALLSGDVLLPKTHSMAAWSDALINYAQKDEVCDTHLSYWKKAEDTSLEFQRLLVSKYNEDKEQKYYKYKLKFNHIETDNLIRRAGFAYQTKINDLLLSAWTITLSNWINTKQVSFRMEGHGRNDVFPEIDVTRTIGWFTTIFPVSLFAPSTTLWSEIIPSIKEQLRKIPDDGLSYGALAYMHPLAEIQNQLNPRALTKISFNYLGQIDLNDTADNDWILTPTASGEQISPVNHYANDLDVNGYVSNNELHFEVIHNLQLCNEEDIKKLLGEFKNNLISLVAHCLEIKSPRFTPSDFSMVSVNQKNLDYIVNTYKQFGTIEALLPLTSMQEAILLHSFDNVESQYQTQISFTLPRQISVEKLTHALLQIISNHSVLRTLIHMDHSEQYQVVFENPVLDLEITDLSGLSECNAELEILDLQKNQFNMTLSLTRPGISRYLLVKLPSTEYRMIWTHHHILLDGWSTANILRELQAHYGSNGLLFVNNKDNFSDYLEYIRSKDIQPAVEYWRSQLHDYDEASTIQSSYIHTNDFGKPSEKKTKAYQFSHEIKTGLVRVCYKLGVTANTVFQFAWGRLLANLANKNDVVYGTTISGRNQPLPNIEQRVGLFIQTVPVRQKFNAKHSISNCIKQLHQNFIEINEFSYLGLTKIQEVSGVKKGESLFNYLFVFENYPGHTDNCAALPISDLSGVDNNNFPLTIMIQDSDYYECLINYRSDLIEDELIEQILSSFETILKNIAIKLDGSYESLCPLTESMLDLIVNKWNLTEKDYSSSQLLHAKIDQCAFETPDSIAIQYDSKEITYKSLYCVTNKLARYFIQSGLLSNQYVGVCMERSELLPIVLVAITKAGGAYVAIDPDYPESRIHFLLEDSKPQLLVTDKKTLNKHTCINNLLDKHSILLSENIYGVIEKYSSDKLDIVVKPNDAAYVIYTSGSTGRPKGVIIEHQAIDNRLEWMQEQFNCEIGDAILQKTPYSFDVSVWELFWPLRESGRLVIAKPNGHKDPQYIIEMIKLFSIAYIHFVPSMLEIFNIEAKGTEFRSLKALICSGESLSLQQVNNYRKNVDLTPIYNLYGPTEASVDVSSECAQEWNTPTIPIGRPISNIQLYVLDPYFQPVPIGIVGELYIAGVGLARGYLNRPDLTNSRFIDINLAGNLNTRVYKTGDLAKYNSAGVIEYIGRTDFQVKLNGNRIELGEIEAILLDMNCFVSVKVLLNQTDGIARLTAFCVPHNECAIDINYVKSVLKEKLPEYMDINDIVIIEQMPMTLSGKVDRNMLLDMIKLRSGTLSTAVVEPTNELERLLTSLWCDLLHVASISIDDNYFSLGGNSITILKLIGALRAHSYHLSLHDCFKFPTIRLLAVLLMKKGKLEDKHGQNMLVEHSNKYPLSKAQSNLWFLDKINNKKELYNIYVTAELKGKLNFEAFKYAIQTVFDRQLALKTKFVLENRVPRQIIDNTIRFDIRQHNDCKISVNFDKYTKALLNNVVTYQFDLEKAPLVHSDVYSYSDDQHVLILIFHHIIADAWSINLLLSEISMVYNATLAGTEIKLPDINYQYTDYVGDQLADLDKNQKEYTQFWVDLLKSNNHPELFIKHQRPKSNQYRGKTIQFELTPSMLNKVKYVSKDHSVSVYQSFLACFQLALGLTSGHNQFVIGGTSSGRDYPELENICGYFVKTLPIPVTIDQNCYLNEYLKKVSSDMIDIYKHQNYSQEQVLEKLEIPRSLNKNPLFQVLFEYHNVAQNNLSLVDLEVSWLYPDLKISKFDLTMTVYESESTAHIAIEFSDEIISYDDVNELKNAFIYIIKNIADSSNESISKLFKKYKTLV